MSERTGEPVAIPLGSPLAASLADPVSRRLVLAVWLLGAVSLLELSGCSDDDPFASPPRSSFGYLVPGDFPRGECKRTSLATLDPAGIYHGLATGIGADAGRQGSISAKVERIGGGDALTGKVFGSFAAWVRKSDDDLVVRFEGGPVDDAQMQVLHFCGVLPSGELVGSYVSCSKRGCAVSRLVGSQVAPLDEAAASGLTLLGETNNGGAWVSPFAVNVRVKDGLAYVARYHHGLSIVDVRDPAAMVVLGELPVELPNEIYNDVKIADGPGGKRFALLASRVAGVVVVDVTDPRAPVRVAKIGATEADLAPNVHTLALDGDLAYLANTRTGLDIFDIADPAAPLLVGHFSHPAQKGYLHDLYVADGRAYLNWWEAGMAIVDVTDPTTPRQLGNFQDYGEHTSHSSWTFEAAGRKLALHGDEQYGAHLRIVDVTEGSPTFAKPIASWMTRPGVSIHNVMAMGQLAVLAYYQDGVRVVDLSDPTSPRQVAWFNTWDSTAAGAGDSFFEGACGVDIDPVTRTLYVADINRGLLVLRLASGI